MLTQSGVIYQYQQPPEKPAPPLQKPGLPAVIPSTRTKVGLVQPRSVSNRFSIAHPVKPAYKAPERPASPFSGSIAPQIEIIPAPRVEVTHLTQASKIVVDTPPPRKKSVIPRYAGMALIVAAIAGVTLPLIPQARLETSYASQQIEKRFDMMFRPQVTMPPSVPLNFTPMIGPDGKEIEPINKDYSIIVPKLGINASVVASVNPLNPKEYTEALKKGVAHAKTSYFPNQDGAVYLFSHSTNYEWFVKDLNAIFYNLKNLEENDLIIVFYKGKRYTYKYKSREIVPPTDTTYLLPVTGKRQLILQTCWPPGSYAQRLMIFADLVEEHGNEI